MPTLPADNPRTVRWLQKPTVTGAGLFSITILRPRKPLISTYHMKPIPVDGPGRGYEVTRRTPLPKPGEESPVYHVLIHPDPQKSHCDCAHASYRGAEAVCKHTLALTALLKQLEGGK